MGNDEKSKVLRFNRIRVFYRLYRKRLIAAFVLLAHIAGAWSSVDAVMQNRTPQGAVAWGISLNLFPYGAVPAYWLFGRSDFEGYVMAMRSGKENFSEAQRKFTQAMERYRLNEKSTGEFERTMQNLAEMDFIKGNRCTLLIDGEQTFESMLEAINSAEKYILFQSYTVRSDGIGEKFKQRLIKKAKEGVKIYFLYDEIGSMGLNDSYLRDLRNAGVAVQSFSTKVGDGRKHQYNFRNHRKILVVDGRTGFAGGFNIGDEYLGKDPKLSPWRDTHMRVDGPAAVALQVPFAEDWYWGARKVLGGLNWQPVVPADGASYVLCIPTGPADPHDTCSLFFLSAISHAKSRLWIATAYFVPDQQIISALHLAVLRGVDVRLIVPDLNDSQLVDLSSHIYLDEIAKAGIRTYRYQKGFMHQKVMLIDNEISCIGSANMDNRSFRLNFEIVLAVKDTAFASSLAAMLEQDMMNSAEVKSGIYAAKPFWFRLAVKVSRLLAPIL